MKTSTVDEHVLPHSKYIWKSDAGSEGSSAGIGISANTPREHLLLLKFGEQFECFPQRHYLKVRTMSYTYCCPHHFPRQ